MKCSVQLFLDKFWRSVTLLLYFQGMTTTTYIRQQKNVFAGSLLAQILLLPKVVFWIQYTQQER